MIKHMICSLERRPGLIYGSWRRDYLVTYECNMSADGLIGYDWMIMWALPCGYAWALIAESGLLI